MTTRIHVFAKKEKVKTSRIDCYSRFVVVRASSSFALRRLSRFFRQFKLALESCERVEELVFPQMQQQDAGVNPNPNGTFSDRVDLNLGGRILWGMERDVRFVTKTGDDGVVVVLMKPTSTQNASNLGFEGLVLKLNKRAPRKLLEFPYEPELIHPSYEVRYNPTPCLSPRFRIFFVTGRHAVLGRQAWLLQGSHRDK